MRWQTLVWTLAMSSAVVLLAQEPSPPINPQEAAKQVNKEVTLQMEVKSSSLREQACFLNSETDFKDAKNFTLFIPREALQKFKDKKIDDPASHFKGKVVRVKGKVTLYRDKPQIVIDNPDQIKEVVKKE